MKGKFILTTVTCSGLAFGLMSMKGSTQSVSNGGKGKIDTVVHNGDTTFVHHDMTVVKEMSYTNPKTGKTEKVVIKSSGAIDDSFLADKNAEYFYNHAGDTVRYGDAMMNDVFMLLPEIN
jgi:hypothetical protein